MASLNQDKFKVGDRVVFVDSEVADIFFPTLGATGTICRVDGDGCPRVKWDKPIGGTLAETYVCDYRLEKYVEPQKVVIWQDPHDMLRVVAKDTATGETGEARCHPDEQESFDFFIGAALALGRLFGHEPEIAKIDVDEHLAQIAADTLHNFIENVEAKAAAAEEFKVGDKIRLKDPERFDTAWAYECAGRGELTVKAVDGCGGLYVEEVPYSFSHEWVEKVEPAEEPNACKFKVGDKVVGNAKANRYGITREGWIGEVIEILDPPSEGFGCDEGIKRTFKARPVNGYGGPWLLAEDAFDLYEDPEEETVIHCNLEENARIIAMIMDFDAEGKVFDWYEQHIQQLSDWYEQQLQARSERLEGKLVCIRSACGWWTEGKVYKAINGVLHDDDGDATVSYRTLEELNSVAPSARLFAFLKE